MGKTLSPSRIAIGLAVAAAVAMPVLMPSWSTLITLILAKGIVVLGIIILLQAGQVSFGHAMFFGIGAYAVAFWGKYVGSGDLLIFLVIGPAIATLFGDTESDATATPKATTSKKGTRSTGAEPTND